jgi:hypothetical protein
MTRRAPVFVLIAFGLVAVALGAAAVWRVPLGQALILRQLAALGVPEARVTVTEVTNARISLSDLSAGEAGEITAGIVEVEYRLPDLLDGRVARIEIQDFVLHLDLNDPADAFGSLQPFVDRLTADEDAAPGGTQDRPQQDIAALPQIRLANGRIEATTPLGLATVTLDGELGADPNSVLALALDLTASSPFGSLAGRLTASGDPQAYLTGTFVITGGALSGPQGAFRADGVEGRIELAAESGAPAAANGDFRIAGLVLAGTKFDSAEARLELTETEAEAHARILTDDGSFDLTFNGQIKEFNDEPRVNIEFKAEVGAHAPLTALAPLPWPESGRARLHATASGALPPMAPLPDSADGFLAWLTQGHFTGRIDTDLEAIALAETAPTFDAAMHWSADWDGATLSLALAEDSRIDAARIDAAALQALGFPDDLAAEALALTGGQVSLTLPADVPQPAKATWRPANGTADLTAEGTAGLDAGPISVTISGLHLSAPAGNPASGRATIDAFSLSGADFAFSGFDIANLAVTGSFDGSPDEFAAEAKVRADLRDPATGDLSATAVDLTLPLRATRQSGTTSVALAAPGRLTAHGLRLAGGLTAERPVEVAIKRCELTLRDGEGGAASLAYAHRTDLAVGQSEFLLPREDGEAIRLAGQAPQVSLTGAGSLNGLYRGEAKVLGAGLALPDFELALDGVSATVILPGDPEQATANFDVAEVRNTAITPAFAPHRLSGQATRRGPQLDLTAEAYGPGDRRAVDITAHHSLADGTGGAVVEIVPLLFSPDGLQPAELSPRFAGVLEMTGSADGTADLEWTPDGLSGTAEVKLDGASFRTEDVAVEDLTLHLSLDELWPASSPPGQMLRAGKIDIGTPVENLVARYRLPPDAPGQVLVEEARFALVGGQFAVRDALIDPASKNTELRVQVDSLSLARLFETLAVEGLSGQGELAGAIPISLQGDQVAVRDARLASRAPGVLRFRSGTASAALQSGGESVELLLKALENFQYDTLSLTGGLDQDGNTDLRLAILGSNPDVLEGHPFQVNINLTGDLGPILDAVRQGHEISSDLLRRSWRLSP